MANRKGEDTAVKNRRKAAKRARAVRRRSKAEDGVSIFERTIQSSGRKVWTGRYRDAVTGKVVQVSLAKLATERARRDWADGISEKLAAARVLGKDRTQREALGLPVTPQEPATRTTPDDARTAFVAQLEGGGEHRPATVRAYKQTSRLFVTWCEQNDVEAVEVIDGPTLTRFRDEITTRQRQVPTEGGERGERKDDRAKLSRASAARYVREVRVFLEFARRRALLPKLTRAGVADALPTVRVRADEMHGADPLDPKRVRSLMQAAIRHDTAREEAVPVSLVLAVTLLTGMRKSEILGLAWSEVDLAAGRIVLPASRTKTRRERSIDLAGTSPMLLALLRRWKLRAPQGPFVLGGPEWLSDAVVKAALRRIADHYKGPSAGLHQLRATCGSYHCNSAIHGAAGPFLAAKALGHGVAVAEKHYTRAIPGADIRAETLEGAMKAEDLFARVLADGDSVEPAQVESVGA